MSHFKLPDLSSGWAFLFLPINSSSNAAAAFAIFSVMAAKCYLYTNSETYSQFVLKNILEVNFLCHSLYRVTNQYPVHKSELSFVLISFKQGVVSVWNTTITQLLVELAKGFRLHQIYHRIRNLPTGYRYIISYI